MLIWGTYAASHGHGWSCERYRAVISPWRSLHKDCPNRVTVSLDMLHGAFGRDCRGRFFHPVFRSNRVPKPLHVMPAPIMLFEWLQANLTGKCVVEIRLSFNMDIHFSMEVSEDERRLDLCFEKAVDAVRYKLEHS